MASSQIKKSNFSIIGYFDIGNEESGQGKLSTDELIARDFQYQAAVQVFTGSLLLLFSILQYYLATLDPLDSNLIINEQCINLSAIYNLPKVHKAI